MDYKIIINGEVAEWFKAHAWKACIGETLSWVRIPFSPPYITNILLIIEKSNLTSRCFKIFFKPIRHKSFS